MKNFLSGIITAFICLAIFGFINNKKEREIPKKEWIIAPRFLTLQKGITKEQAREWMENEYLPLYRYHSGWNAQLGEPTASGKWGKSDNTAKEKGDFVLIYFFDSPKTRDHYFHPMGVGVKTLKKSNNVDKNKRSFIQNKLDEENKSRYFRLVIG